MHQPRATAVRPADDQRSATPIPTALRYVTEIQPCPEVAAPKVTTRQQRRTPGALPRTPRGRTASACRALSAAYRQALPLKRWHDAVAGLLALQAEYAAWCELCRTVSATPPPLWPYRPSSISISMNSPPSCHRVDTVAIDDHIAIAHPGPPEKFSKSRSCRLTNTREE